MSVRFMKRILVKVRAGFRVRVNARSCFGSDQCKDACKCKCQGRGKGKGKGKDKGKGKGKGNGLKVLRF